MSDWDESKHPRDKIGRFTYGATDAEKKRLRELGIDEKQQLSRQEWAILRSEVMRKNATQNGIVKPLNFAFTANYFYVYSTNGNDDFNVIKSFDIEEEPEVIDFYINLIEDKK